MMLWLQRVIAALAVVSLYACTSDAKESVAKSSTFELSNPYSEQIYQILLAEYHFQKGHVKKSADLYSQISADNKKPDVAKRTTEILLHNEDYDHALISAKRWKKLQPDSSDVNQYLVLLHQKKNQFVEAAAALAEMVKTYPAEKAKGIDVAVALLEQQGEQKKAYKTLNQYVLNHDKNHDAHYFLALFAMRAKLYDEALEVTLNLRDIENKEIQRKTALIRVRAYSALEKPELALSELSKLIAEAADVKTRQRYARLMASLGKGDDAVAMLGEVYEKHPGNADLLLDMIAINLGNEKYLDSLPLVEKLSEIEGQEYNSHYYRGLIYESEEEFAKALGEYQAISDNPKNIQLVSRMVAVLEELKGLESALSYLHEQQDKHQRSSLLVSLYLLESEILRDSKLFEDALEANQNAAKLSPMNLDIIYSQALLYEDLKQIDKSEEMLQKILEIDKDNSAALNALGYMLSVHTSRFDEAYHYIKRAYDLEPEDPAIIDSLGWVSYRKGDLDSAEHYLRMAYQKLQDPEVASHLIEVLSKQGHMEEAQKLLKEMLERHPGNEKLLEAQAIIMSMKSE